MYMYISPIQMCVYIYIYKQLYTCVCVYLSLSLSLSIYIYTYMHTYIHIIYIDTLNIRRRDVGERRGAGALGQQHLGAPSERCYYYIVSIIIII